jgi:hypothetical protein
VKQLISFLFALLVSLILSWPFVRMSETVKACGWSGLLYECRIITPKAEDNDE